MKLRILYHGNCFDGVSSAAVFARFYQERVNPGWDVAFQPMMHRAGALFDEDAFDGDENAIVDFKYSPAPNLTWWFDHHRSAFLTPEDEAHFNRDTSGRKFLDASYKSCTKFIADTAAARFGFDPTPLGDLVHWANIIDGALYESAAEAVEMKAPALRLALVIEADRDTSLIERIIRDLMTISPDEVVAAEYVASRIEPLYQRHLRSIDLIRNKGQVSDSVLFFDVSDSDMEGYSKFIPYYLYPQATYTVSVSESTFRTKVSVGSNPWVKGELKHNLASICERYGGGGHPRVGAISFPLGAIGPAREAAKEIVAELQT